MLIVIERSGMDFGARTLPRKITPPFSNLFGIPSEVLKCIFPESTRMNRVASRWIRHPDYSGMLCQIDPGALKN